MQDQRAAVFLVWHRPIITATYRPNAGQPIHSLSGFESEFKSILVSRRLSVAAMKP